MAYNGEILLVHHAASGLWGFPKGKIEEQESAEDAALRELAEETGVRIQRGQLGSAFRCNDTKYYCVVLDAAPPVAVDQWEIDSYKWLALGDLDAANYHMSTITRKVVRKLQAGSGRRIRPKLAGMDTPQI